MVRKAIISVYDWAQDPNVMIVGGTWESRLPATNMLSLQPQYVAQAVGTTVSFTVNLGVTRTIGLFSLQRLITANNGTIRIQAGTYDSTTVGSWPSDAGGIYPPLLYAALGRPRVFIPPTPVAISSFTVTINAVSGYLQIGNINAFEILEPPNNMLIGPVYTIQDESSIETIAFGSTYVTLRGKRRVIDFAFPPTVDSNLSSDEYTDDYADLFDLALVNGKSAPVIVVKYPDDVEKLERNSVWGTISNNAQFTNRFYGYHDSVFQIKQLI